MANETDPGVPDSRENVFRGFDDAYGEGFADGRRSMALAVVRKFLPLHSDSALSDVTGLPEAEIAALRDPDAHARTAASAADAVRESDGPRLWSRDAPAHGTMLVEPGFVRLVRAARSFTQAALAKRLGVHERTVCAWESADMPIRMRSATYELLKKLSPSETQSRDETPRQDIP
ncbi:MAG: helix-turn-helix transcriptional regulator [Kiritimatiellae bacterium]|jgi:DNA-binding transcriptional regulator YiaG|nr:helix-turn-helix transcriptional regulator [Kiritimatiellia bacterium]